MIKKLKYKEINFDKYAESLEKSCQNSDYAEPHFLDIVSDRKWFLLVYNDYEAVMPVAYVRKFGVPFILMPKICQQLGVFSQVDQPEVNSLFYNYLVHHFLVLMYAFNADNKFNHPVEFKISYLLQRNNYLEIKKNYSVHRRRNVRIIGDLQGNITLRKKLNHKDFGFFLKNVKGLNSQRQKEEYFRVLKELLAHDIGDLRIFEYKEQTQSFVYMFEGVKNRYLSLFINEYPPLNSNFPSITIDQALQEFIEDKNFDFMGSEVEKVAQFNERFGAISYQYPILMQTKQTLFKNLWKSYRIITNFAL